MVRLEDKERRARLASRRRTEDDRRVSALTRICEAVQLRSDKVIVALATPGVVEGVSLRAIPIWVEWLTLSYSR